MIIDYMEKCRTLYDQNFKKKYGVPIGCSEIEIIKYEEAHEVIFPKSYKHFLLWMGKDYKGIFRGSEWFLKDIFVNTQYLDSFLSVNNIKVSHPSKPICFFSHQGYMSAWFYSDLNFDDPPCYFFSEGAQDNIIMKYDSFTDFLMVELASGLDLRP